MGSGSPAVKQSSANAQQARLMSMVVMLDVLKHLLCVADISGRERVVPGFKQEAVWVRRSVLKKKQTGRGGEVA